MKKNPTTLWKIISAVLCVALIVVTVCWVSGIGKASGSTESKTESTVTPEPTKEAEPTEAPTEAPTPTKEPEPTEAPKPTEAPVPTISRRSVTDTASQIGGEDALSLWNDSAKLKTELQDYVKAVTDESSADFIPVEDRIAVFDFDGTLFCETDPNYFDYTLLVYRVTEDPDYKDKASDFEKEVADKIIQVNTTGAKFEGLEVDHGKAVASAFKGMTPEEFYEYVGKFMQLDMPSYEGMKRGEGFYKPMLQVVDYLEMNDFTVYIVSGTDRLIVRGLVKNSEMLDLPAKQIIGSDETVVGTEQGDTDGLQYFLHDDQVVLGGEFIIKNLKMNKVTAILRDIGQQPVLSFGNSSGDGSMDNFVIHNNKYKTGCFMLCCDDLERENGKQKKADEMYALCEENGWTPVSMKDDWKTIYGDGVTYIPATQEEELAPAA